jgi:hypothetical protein
MKGFNVKLVIYCNIDAGYCSIAISRRSQVDKSKGNHYPSDDPEIVADG